MGDLKFFVVESRSNRTLDNCVRAATLAGVDLEVLSSTEPGLEFNELSNNYVHRSTNPREFELICFRRYFLLAAHLRGRSIREFVLIDSDVLLFSGISEHIKRVVGDGDFAGSGIYPLLNVHKQISPHVSYWTTESLTDFVGFLRRAYVVPSILEELAAIQSEYKGRQERGGISDMTLIYIWARERRRMTLLNRTHKGAVIDHNISISDNYRVREFQHAFRFKRVLFVGKTPYFHTVDGTRVRALAIHFQGRAKLCMRYGVQPRPFLFAVSSMLIGLAKAIRMAQYRLTSCPKQ